MTDKIKFNNDIEQVLSDSYSINSNENENVKVNKLDSKDNELKIVENEIKDKVELSSNKDIEIGLDLLVNKDKAHKDTDQQDKDNLSDKYNISVEDNKSFDKIENMVNELNMDNVSRLSQD